METEKYQKRTFRIPGLIILLVVYFFGFGLSLKVILPQPDAPLPDVTGLPPQYQSKPDAYAVGSMPNGWSGWVDHEAVWVDKDSVVWIAADCIVAQSPHTWTWGDLHIQREGDYIILFHESIGANTWVPGGASNWRVDQKPDLLPVKIR